VTLNVNLDTKYQLSMIICGSYMLEFSVGKDMKKCFTCKEVTIGEDSDMFMSNINYQGIEK